MIVIGRDRWGGGSCRFGTPEAERLVWKRYRLRFWKKFQIQK